VREAYPMLDEYEKAREFLESAVTVARREWENIRKSLELCGDAGEFDKDEFMIGSIDEDVIIRQSLLQPTKSVSVYSTTFYPIYFVRNLMRMDGKMPEKGYKTVEALYTYVELVDKAAKRLGLKGTFSMSFASGYAYCRTGWLSEKANPEARDLFFNMFFPRDLFCRGRSDYDWEFHWSSVQERLKKIFDRFTAWQGDEGMFRKEVRRKSKVIPMMV